MATTECNQNIQLHFFYFLIHVIQISQETKQQQQQQQQQHAYTNNWFASSSLEWHRKENIWRLDQSKINDVQGTHCVAVQAQQRKTRNAFAEVRIWHSQRQVRVCEIGHRVSKTQPPKSWKSQKPKRKAWGRKRGLLPRRRQRQLHDSRRGATIVQPT